MRDEARLDAFRTACDDRFAWGHVGSSGMPLYTLALGDCREAAAHASCFQAIVGDSAFSLGMVADFARTLEENGAWAYRRLFWETGLIGQVLYLEAEAAGVRSTGMGCYFDDFVHQLLGIDLPNDAWQSLYHFTVGGPKFTNQVQHRYGPELRWASTMTSSILMIVSRYPVCIQTGYLAARLAA